MPEVVVQAAAPHYTVISASPAFLRIFGYEAKQMVGRGLRILNGPCTNVPGLVGLIADAGAAVDDGAPPKAARQVLVALYGYNGGLRLMSVEARAIDGGACVRLRICQAQAITPQEAFADDGACKMVLSVETRRVEAVSMAFSSRYGSSNKAARGRTPGSMIQGPGSDVQCLPALMDAALGGLCQRSPLLTFGSECQEIPAMATVTPVYDGKGRVSHFMLAIEQDRPAEKRRNALSVKLTGSLRSLSVPSAANQTSNVESRGVFIKAAILFLALPAFLHMGPIMALGHAGVGAQLGATLRPGPRPSGALFESQNSWSKYKNYSPPKGFRGHHGDTDIVLETKDGNSNRLTLMIDLDKTALYGNDGNDLGVALQWMDKCHSHVEELYRKLINPNLRSMYDHYVQQGKQLDVVVYTRRPQVVYYKSCVRHNTVPVRYADEWHGQGQLYFPSSIKSSEDIFATYAGPELLEDEQNDVKKSLDRLLAARDAIMHELGLSTPPPVVVTAQAKDVHTTARYFGVPADQCLLFDDNVELRNDPRVVLVDPLESLPAKRRSDLISFMQQQLPAEELEEDLIEYLEEARADEMSIKRGADGKLSWWVPETKGTTSGWKTPEAIPTRSPSHHMLPLPAGAKSLDNFDKHAAKNNEPFSNVSPADVPLRAGRGLIDLCAAAEKAAIMRNIDYENQVTALR